MAGCLKNPVLEFFAERSGFQKLDFKNEAFSSSNDGR